MMFLYYPYFALLWLMSLLPLRVHYVFSDLILYPIARYVIKYRRKVVRKNLAEAFPEKPVKELREIERRFYHIMCDFIVEDLKLCSMSANQINKRMVWKGLEHISSNPNTITVMFIGHTGNWEYMAAMNLWATGYHVVHVYHKLYNKLANRLLLRNREQYGCECVKMRHTYRRLLALKRANTKTIAGFIADQQPKWKAIHHFSHFLNHDTAVFIGGEHIAKKLDAAVVYLSFTRPRRGYYQAEIIPITSNPSDFPDYEITDRYMQLLEEDIKREPYLWLWSHKRWSRTKEEWLRRQETQSSQQ